MANRPLLFDNAELQAIARALGDTSFGFTGSEIADILSSLGLPDPGEMTKWKRLYQSFLLAQERIGKRKPVISFIRESMKQHRHLGRTGRLEDMREALNAALMLSGLVVDCEGILTTTTKVRTVASAEQRARSLRQTLEARNVHQDVIRFCRAEYLAKDYFHAVFEACKSVSDKIRFISGLSTDGNTLVNEAFGNNPPLLKINNHATSSEINEHRGFANLLRGIVSMFRNPTAHEPRVSWLITQQDAEDLMSLLSLIHRRLDNASRST